MCNDFINDGLHVQMKTGPGGPEPDGDMQLIDRKTVLLQRTADRNRQNGGKDDGNYSIKGGGR